MLSTKWDVMFQIDCIFSNSSSATYTLLSCLCTKQATVLALPNKQTSPQSKHKRPRQQSAFFSALFLLLYVAHCHLTDDITTHLCHPVSYTVHAAMLQEWIEKEEKGGKQKSMWDSQWGNSLTWLRSRGTTIAQSWNSHCLYCLRVKWQIKTESLWYVVNHKVIQCVNKVTAYISWHYKHYELYDGCGTAENIFFLLHIK